MNNSAFFEAVRKSGLFGSSLKQSHVDGLTAIVEEAERRDIPLRQLAYILATAYHETAHTMLPVRETMASSDDRAIGILEAAWKSGKLKWVKTPYWRKDADGKSWLGRGYVQLTHKSNYQRSGLSLGIDLVSNPDRAMEPRIAALIMFDGMLKGLFTGKKLSDYIDGIKADYINARRIINGTDKAELIAGYAIKFEWALKAGNYGTVTAVLPPIQLPPADPVPSAPVTSNILSAIFSLVAAFLRGAK